MRLGPSTLMPVAKKNNGHIKFPPNHASKIRRPQWPGHSGIDKTGAHNKQLSQHIGQPHRRFQQGKKRRGVRLVPGSLANRSKKGARFWQFHRNFASLLW